MNNFLVELKKYFESTTQEKILEDWSKSEEFDEIGPSVEEFFKYSKHILSNDNQLLNELATSQIKELIDDGWLFMLDYGQSGTGNKTPIQWEADFTRKLSNGLYDNHKSGHGNSPNDAVHNAYQNIKLGIKLRP